MDAQRASGDGRTEDHVLRRQRRRTGLREGARRVGGDLRRALPLDVLETADEVFITSSTRDVFAVHAVDDRQLAPGPVTNRAAKIFAARGSEDLDP